MAIFLRMFSTIGLLAVCVGLVVGGVLLLDYVGLIDKEKQLYPYLARVPILGKYFYPVEPVDPELLTYERLRHIQESIRLQAEQLHAKELELKEKELRLTEMEKQLSQREEEIERRLEGLQEQLKLYEDEERNWQKLALYYQSMRPREAALILQNMDDWMIINLLRRMKDETVAITLMNMDRQRAADISRKMVR